jgi:hypothetical protein
MAFKVGAFEDVTIMGITDPYLAAAIRKLGKYWEEVKDLPEAQAIVDQAVRGAEDMADKAARLAAAGHRHHAAG